MTVHSVSFKIVTPLEAHCEYLSLFVYLSLSVCSCLCICNPVSISPLWKALCFRTEVLPAGESLQQQQSTLQYCKPGWGPSRERMGPSLEPGRIIPTELQGGLDGPISLSTYVLIALLEDDSYKVGVMLQYSMCFGLWFSKSVKSLWLTFILFLLFRTCMRAKFP